MSLIVATIWFYSLVTMVLSRPNFVFILMDDQDVYLDSPSFMPNLQSLIVNNGITFSNAFVATPVCCPSRTENLSGRYFHNVGAPKGGCMRVDALGNIFSGNSMYSVLHNNGYKTGVFGKLTNQDAKYFCNNEQYYKNITDGAGMDRVYSMCESQDNFYCSKYFNKFVNNTFTFTNLSANDPSTYQSSQIGNQSLQFIENMLKSNLPFFNYIGFHDPHIPYTVAPWYLDYYNQLTIDNVTVPMTPDWNTQTNDTLWWVNEQPALNNYSQTWVHNIYRARIASTQQTDFYIKELFKILNKYNALDNTYIIYTSDHGYHLGNHRIPCEKFLAYDHDIRVPFYMHIPNNTNNMNVTVEYIITQVDIMPTVLDLSGIQIPNVVDGKTFKKILDNLDNKNIEWRDMILSEFIDFADVYFDHCDTWFPKTNDFHGQILTPSNTHNINQKNDTLTLLWGNNENPGNT
eukprot:9420_1